MNSHLVNLATYAFAVLVLALPAAATPSDSYRVPVELIQRTFSAMLDFGMVAPEVEPPLATPLRQRRSAESYIRGRQASIKEQFREAERHWRDAVGFDPANAAAWTELGFLLAGTQRFQPALEAWRRALDVQGDADPSLLLSCGLLETAGGEHAEAAVHLLRRRLLESEDVEASLELIQLDAALALSLRTLGNLDLARALEQERDAMLLEYASRQSDELGAAQDWMRLVEELYTLGALDAAMEAARVRLLNGSMDGQYAPYLAAQLKMRFVLISALLAGDGREVIELFDALNERGLLRGIPSDWRKPKSMAEALYEAGTDFHTLSNDAGAARLFAEVLAHDPSHVLARNNLGYMALETGPITMQDIELIEGALADARDGHPDLAKVLDTAGWLRYMQSHLADDEHAIGALSMFQEALELLGDEPDPVVIDHMGDAFWLAGYREEAVMYWTAAQTIVERPEFRGQKLREYNLLQGGLWQFRVVDSQSLYDRDYGSLAESLAAKLDAVEAGTPPPVAARRRFIR
ncbi:MAG: hypothetical protein MK095_06275 [Phycisphaerales bacterium]|nr:hypothetical protein [Phycisphaerales bacterium]